MTTQHIAAHRTLRVAGIVSAVALTLGLAACNRQDDRTVGQRVDSAAEKTEQAARDLKADAKQGMETAKTEARDAANVVEAKVDDMTITAAVNAGLAKDPDLSAVRINVDTKSGVVTLTGPAPTPVAKERATSIAQTVKGVAGVNNNLEVRAG